MKDLKKLGELKMRTLESYLLENMYSNINVWIFTKDEEMLVYGTCNELFNKCSKYILHRKVLKIETDNFFTDINIFINM